MRSSLSSRVIITIILIATAVLTILPIVWLIVTAFLQSRAIVAPGIDLSFALQNFQSVFDPSADYGRQVLNSLLIVVLGTALCVVVAALAGYSLSQLNWSPRGVLIVLAGLGLLQVVPPMTLVPGIFVLLNTLHLNNTLGALILLDAVFNLPFAVIMAKFYFDSIPGELRESAAIDGASDFGAFRRIMLPLAMPGISAITIFTAIQVWNEFLFGLVFTTGGTSAPLTVGIATLIQPQQIQYGPMAAVGVVTAVPIIVLGIVANRQIVAGLTRGAVKG